MNRGPDPEVFAELLAHPGMPESNERPEERERLQLLKLKAVSENRGVPMPEDLAARLREIQGSR